MTEVAPPFFWNKYRQWSKNAVLYDAPEKHAPKHRRKMSTDEVVHNDIRKMTFKEWETFPLHMMFEGLTYRTKVTTEYYQ